MAERDRLRACLAALPEDERKALEAEAEKTNPRLFASCRLDVSHQREELVLDALDRKQRSQRARRDRT
ncbi:MAG: hypothetical protein Q8R92_03495 [Deltaproteobacteria bacterium]|nr:hypothetical protein [Deltaproteobacteria bacterium]